jgi:polysaccharide biosynthesis protein PelC
MPPRKGRDMLTSRSQMLVAALAATALAGCASSGPKYHDRNMDFGSIRTVAVMPFANLSRDNQGADRVRDVFSNMLLATEALYVLPAGEVARGIGRVGIPNATAPSAEEVTKLGQTLKVDAIITGVLKEYGEVRSGSAMANVISLTVQMQEVATGKVVWSASSTKGGITFGDRLLGGGGVPMNHLTEEAVNDVLDKLFK